MAFKILTPEEYNLLEDNIKQSKKLFEKYYRDEVETQTIIYHKQEDIYYFFYQKKKKRPDFSSYRKEVDFLNIHDVYSYHSKEIRYVLQCINNHEVMPLLWFRKNFYNFSNHDGPILALKNLKNKIIPGYININELRDSDLPIMYLLARDDYAFEHSLRVQKYVKYLLDHVNTSLAKRSRYIIYKYDPHDIDHLCFTGLIHDLGKVYCKDEILMKPTDLTLEDRYHINRHPIFSCGLLSFTRASLMPGKILYPIIFHHLTPTLTKRLLKEAIFENESNKIETYRKALIAISILKVCDSLDSLLSRKFKEKGCIATICTKLAKEYENPEKNGYNENSKLPLAKNAFDNYIRKTICQWLQSPETHENIASQRYGLTFNISALKNNTVNEISAYESILAEVGNLGTKKKSIHP
jgi:HD-GYP domain-containing protein (c-di-GMP phosphodiesterase class II)